jgi:uncharacterized membrane protein YsdA (DUF1294 family)
VWVGIEAYALFFWIAQQAFRHKSRKVSFQVEFWIAVAINVAVLAWLVQSGGNPLALLER